MSVNGIVAKRQRSFKRTTVQHPSRKAAKNHLAQRFRASRPNQVWLADMTYIGTGQGWLYLAAVMDLYSRRIIGWSMSNRMTEELTLSALKMAAMKRLPAHSKLMHHSDRGSQYTSKNYQQLLDSYGIQVSMSSTGNCYDNAPMESFFSLLKTEMAHHESYKTRQEARSRLFDYMEVFYNRQRIHSAIDYESPVIFERQWQEANGDCRISHGPLGGRGAQNHP
jgi:transposase InsO family protein